MIDARKLLLGIVLAALALGSWWLTHRAAQPPGPPAARASHLPDYTIDGFTGNAMNAQGRREYRLTAQRLVHYPDDGTTHFAHPVLVQFLPGGVRTTTRANAGVIPADGREIIMTGDVHVTRTGGSAAPGGETTAERLRVELDR